MVKKARTEAQKAHLDRINQAKKERAAAAAAENDAAASESGAGPAASGVVASDNTPRSPRAPSIEPLSPVFPAPALPLPLPAAPSTPAPAPPAARSPVPTIEDQLELRRAAEAEAQRLEEEDERRRIKALRAASVARMAEMGRPLSPVREPSPAALAELLPAGPAALAPGRQVSTFATTTRANSPFFPLVSPRVPSPDLFEDYEDLLDFPAPVAPQAGARPARSVLPSAARKRKLSLDREAEDLPVAKKVLSEPLPGPSHGVNEDRSQGAVVPPRALAPLPLDHPDHPSVWRRKHPLFAKSYAAFDAEQKAKAAAAREAERQANASAALSALAAPRTPLPSARSRAPSPFDDDDDDEFLPSDRVSSDDDLEEDEFLPDPASSRAGPPLKARSETPPLADAAPSAPTRRRRSAASASVPGKRREDACQRCLFSALSGNSAGECYDLASGKGARCVRCSGGHTCVVVPYVFRGLVKEFCELAAVRKEKGANKSRLEKLRTALKVIFPSSADEDSGAPSSKKKQTKRVLRADMRPHAEGGSEVSQKQLDMVTNFMAKNMVNMYVSAKK